MKKFSSFTHPHDIPDICLSFVLQLNTNKDIRNIMNLYESI